MLIKTQCNSVSCNYKANKQTNAKPKSSEQDPLGMLGFLLEVRYASFKAQANIQLKESCMCGVHICITTVLCERFDVQT